MGAVPIDYEMHCVIPFGACVQAEHPNNPTNTMEERTKDAVHLDAIDGPQGGHRCMNLKSGEEITTQKVYELPVTDLVRERVKRLARKTRMPLTLTFADPTEKQPDDNDDGAIVADDDASIAGVDEEESLQPEEPPDEDDLYHLVNEEDGPEITDLTSDDECYETQDRLQESNKPIDQQQSIIKQEV